MTQDFTIKVGARKRFYCGDCCTEYEVLHEPEYTDPAMQQGFGGKPKPASFCPFCGSDADDDNEIEVRS